MTSRPGTLVRAQREARGYSQQALAERIGLSRQSLSAIEAGRVSPAVDIALRLAEALGTSVERLFGPRQAQLLHAVAARPELTGRVALTEVAGRWVAHPLAGANARLAADAVVVERSGAQLAVEPLSGLEQARANLIVMGCALALGLLAERLNGRPGPGRCLWLPSSSGAALEALARGEVQLAGVHLVDGSTGADNVVDVRRQLPSTPVTLVTLARWEAGLVTRPGEPRAIRHPRELARRGLRVVTREPGSGARRLLDRTLREVGVSAPRGERWVQAPGHLEVAQLVALGAADVGVATRDAAISHGLGFVPLAEERYDLVVPTELLADARVRRLLEVLTSRELRRELTELGYDVRGAGDTVTELSAAGRAPRRLPGEPLGAR